MNKKLIGNIILVFFISIFMYILMVNRPKNIVIKVDGKIIEHKSTAKNVKEIIDEANIELNEEDKINYRLDEKIINNQEIVINRIYSIDEEVIEEKLGIVSNRMLCYRMKKAEEKILINKKFRDEYFELEDKIKENFKNA